MLDLVFLVAIALPVAAFLAAENMKVVGGPRLLLSLGSVTPAITFLLIAGTKWISIETLIGSTIIGSFAIFCFGINAVKAFIPTK